MSKMKWKLSVLFVVLALLCSLSIFAADRAGAADNVLRIGSLNPLIIKEGLEQKKWHELLTKIVNEQGGLKVGGKTYKLEFFTYDVAFEDPTKTMAALQKAIHQDGVKILINNFGSVDSIVANQADQNKVLVLGMGPSDEPVTTKHQYFFRPVGGFYIAGTNYLIAHDFVKKGAKSSVVCTIDTENGRVTAERYGNAEKLAGLKVLPPIFFSTDTVDFGPIATKIKSLNPDMVDFGVNFGPTILNLAVALKDVGWKGFIFPGSILSNDLIKNIYAKVGDWFDGAETLYLDPRGIPEVIEKPEMKALVDRYIKEYGDFQTDGCYWVSSWFVMMDAIKATQSVDPTVLKGYLEKGPKPSLGMGGYIQLFARPDIGQLRTVDGMGSTGRGITKNGKLEYFEQLDVKDQYLMTIQLHGLVDVYEKYWEKYGKPKFPPEKSAWDFSDLKK